MSDPADKPDIIELLYRYTEHIDAGDFDGVGAAGIDVLSIRALNLWPSGRLPLPAGRDAR